MELKGTSSDLGPLKALSEKEGAAILANANTQIFVVPDGPVYPKLVIDTVERGMSTPPEFYERIKRK